MFKIFESILGKGNRSEKEREPVGVLFDRFVAGLITESQLVTALGVERVDDFCQYWEQRKAKVGLSNDR